jgi:hypothetical protein
VSGRTARAASVAVAVVTLGLATGCAAVQANQRPLCHYGGPTLLMAEAVPTAQMVPCVRDLPLGWHFGSFRAGSDDARFTLDSDAAGKGALSVELIPACNPGSARRISSDEGGTALYRAGSGAGGSPALGTPAAGGGVFGTRAPTDEWLYVYPGGCARYAFVLPAARASALEGQIRRGLSFMPRATLARELRRQTGRDLDPEQPTP